MINWSISQSANWCIQTHCFIKPAVQKLKIFNFTEKQERLHSFGSWNQRIIGIFLEKWLKWLVDHQNSGILIFSHVIHLLIISVKREQNVFLNWQTQRINAMAGWSSVYIMLAAKAAALISWNIFPFMPGKVGELKTFMVPLLI